MLNDLVNSTGPYCSSYNRTIDSCICEDITELFECYNEVKAQSDENCQSLQKLSTYINCDNGNIDANNISASSATINGLVSCGINANSITANNVCASNKLETKCAEAENITTNNLNASNISASNLTGLTSLTVEGQATVDKLLADEIETAGKVTASSMEATTAEVTTLESTNIDASNISAACVDTNSIEAEDAVINKACIGNLSTSCFSSDEIATSKINSTSLSVPKLETSGGITGKGKIDTTSSVWKEIRIPLFTGTVQFYTDEWKVTIVGGREFIWEDESLDHLKFISNDGTTVTVAVDWDDEVYYTYNVAKTAPIITLVDNTGTTPANDYTYIMKDSGVLRGTVFIYQDKAFTNQGLTILGNLQASNLEITCGESIDCLSIENLYVGNTLRSENPIEVDICARSVCIASPCTYITDCLYTDCIYSDCVISDYVYGKDLDYGTIYAKAYNECCPRPVLSYCEGVLATAYNVCVNSDTVWSDKSCADTFYGDELNVKCANVDDTLTAKEAITEDATTDRLSVSQCAKFNGPVYLYDNIYQCGTAYCTHAQNIYTCSDTITMREGADFAGKAQIKVLKYDGTNNGVIQLGTDGTLRIGDEANCQPVLTRSEVGSLSDGHVLVWDATNKCAKDGGDAIVTCDYVKCIGKECKTAACNYATCIGTECKTAACEYTNCVSTQCKSASCAFTVSCSHAIGTSCKNAACTFASACGHLIGTSCKNASCAFAVSCGHEIGTSCKNASCAFTATCGHEIGTACKTAACTYANTVAGQCKTAACTYANTVAFCNINTCKGIGVMAVNRGAEGQCWTKAGYWAYMTTKDGPNCCWNHIIKMDWSAAGADLWTSGISVPTYNAPNSGIHYKAACCGGTSGWTLVPNITCAQNLGLSCRNIAQACACSFTVACVNAAQPDTSPFACSYGGSRTCVNASATTWMSGNNNNGFYKVPFTCFAAASAIAQNMPLYVDSAHVFPSYNPSTNVFCTYTTCVAQTLAVRNANGGFRLGSYCIYIG